MPLSHVVSFRLAACIGSWALAHCIDPLTSDLLDVVLDLLGLARLALSDSFFCSCALLQDFPTTDAALSGGRGSRALPLDLGKRTHVLFTEVLRVFSKAMPEAIPELRRLMNASHIGLMNWVGTEFQGLPTLRFYSEGERIILAMPRARVVSCVTSVGKVDGNAPLASILKALTEITDFDGHKNTNNHIEGFVYSRVGRKSAVYIPAGYVLHERSMNRSVGYGARSPIYISTSSADATAFTDYLDSTNNDGAATLKKYFGRRAPITAPETPAPAAADDPPQAPP